MPAASPLNLSTTAKNNPMDTKFEDIRPYHESEIPAAMQRIAHSEHLPAMAKFVFPGKSIEEVKELVSNCKTVDDFQAKVMYEFNEQVIKSTIHRFSYSGIEHLDPQKSYLFVSNHRDIVLDSSLLQQALYKNGFRTSEITFGSNLMSSQLLVDIGNSNKMFKVSRGETPREFYKTSLQLSEYIRYTISQKGESVWIAQRNGRTKDGNDATDPGIIKMFCMSATPDLADAIDEIHIVPIAISYQWEPCDLFKTREICLSRDGAKYIKQKDEDYISVLTGIMQPKGDVHVSICKPLVKEELPAASSADFYKNVASLIDRRIHESYKLFATNYIARDLQTDSTEFSSRYSAQEKEQFLQRLQQVLASVDGDKEQIRSVFLGIYANPCKVKR